MLLLLVIILFGMLIGIFATQNTGLTQIALGNYQLSGIPLYVIALGGLLIGVLISWILSFFGAMSSFMTLRGKDSKINDLRKSLTDMKQKIRDLEVENARLRGEHDTDRPRFGFAGPTKAVK